MKNNYISSIYRKFLTCIILLLLYTLSLAHPEDEFCVDTEMDPLLCAQLSELDRSTESGTYSLPTIELDRPPTDTFLLYTKLGIEHIIPMGLDHLAFVLALLLSSSALRPLFIQISLFTLAHSITLILSVMGILVLQGVWIEVAIAFSIVFVAVENIFIKSPKPWRWLIIFCFGLLHGLGFAGALGELGIPQQHFISALLGFNLGVEIGQLGFALLVFLILYRFLKRAWYFRYVVVPGSLMIASVGSYWVIERLL